MKPEPSFNPLEADLLTSVRLEASAGTGKTYNLERVVCELVARYEIPLSSILVVTFTNKAARELRERIRTILSELSRPEAGRTPKEQKLLSEARHNYDQAAIYTIHGFCQHVLQTYPFESGSPFQQEFLSDNSLAEEGVRDFLYGRFRRIGGEDRDLIRGFLKGSSSLEEGIEKLVRIAADEMDAGTLTLIPGRNQLDLALAETKNFAAGKGAVYQAVSALFNLSWSSDEVLTVFKTLKTRQKAVTAEKIGRVGGLLPGTGDLPSWLDWFYSRQDNLGAAPAELLLNLAEPVLEEKCGKGCSLDDLTDKSLIRGITDLFEALEPFSDGGFSAKGIHRKLLGYAFLREAVDGAVPLIRDKKKVRGLRDFSDLIRGLHDILTEEPDGPLAATLRNQYKVVLVDEFQDTDRQQWDIFRILFGQDADHNYFLIGDPKQSIYGFRGADLTVYFQACDSVAEEQRFSLGTNYRSRRAVVAGCNYLFERLFALPSIGSRSVPFQAVDAAGVKGALPRDCQGRELPAMTFCEVRHPGDKDIESRGNLKDDWIQDIARRAEEMIRDGSTLEDQTGSRRIRAGDIAVLMDTNRDCEAMQLQLEARGISAVIYSDRRVLDAPEADLFGHILKCLAFPADNSALTALLISPVFQLTPATLSLVEQSEQLDQIIMAFHRWKDITDRGGLIRVFHSLFEQENIFPLEGLEVSWKNRLLHLRQGDRSCTNLLHLAEIFHQEQRTRKLDARGLYDHYVRLRHNPGMDDQRQVRLDKDGESVQILTHHSSKGLEYPVVFFCGALNNGSVGNRADLTFYWEGKRYRDYLLTSDSRKKAALADWEERKRLYYVSLTRASSLLYLPFFPQGDFCYLTNIYAALCGDDLVSEEHDLLKPLPLSEQWPLHSEAKWQKSGAIKKKKAALNDKMAEILQDICHRNSDLFRFSIPAGEEADTLPLFPPGYLEQPEEESIRLAAASWKGGTPFYKRVISVESFSSLTAGAHGRIPAQDIDVVIDDADRDGGDAGAPEEDFPEEVLEEQPGPLGLTRGAEFGNLVHYIFETIDFSWGDIPLDQWFAKAGEPSPQEVFLEEATERFFDQGWWLQSCRALGELVWNVLNCPLKGCRELKHIGPEDRKHELEFLFRVSEATRMQVQEWSVPVEKGFLKGFIDVIFRHEGKLYIGDWKTTVPAGKGVLSDYDEEMLKETMHSHLYDVQAMVYAQALRRYMLSLDPDFSYEKDFGGIYYFFVRGMGEEGDRGVHFFRPDSKELDRFMPGCLDNA